MISSFQQDEIQLLLKIFLRAFIAQAMEERATDSVNHDDRPSDDQIHTLQSLCSGDAEGDQRSLSNQGQVGWLKHF